MKIPKEFAHLDINSAMEKALESIFFQHRNTLIMGNAGSGKSTMLELCKAIDEKNKVSTAFLAYTGVSAVLIDGMTLHSFFKLPLSPVIPENVGLNEDVATLIRATKRLYIDEISFVRADVLDIIDSLCKRALEVYHKPFGGLQVIMTGDLMQLKAFISGEEAQAPIFQTRYYNGISFFDSGVFSTQSESFTKIEFSKIYRQKVLNDTDVLNRIRIGEQTQEDLAYINKRVMPVEEFEKQEANFITLAPYNKTVQRINIQKLSEMPGDEFLIPAEMWGNVNLKNHLVEQDLWLKPMAKIMTLVNRFDQGFQNGSIGTFVRVIDRDTLLIRINGQSVPIVRYEFNEFTYTVKNGELVKTLKGTLSQFPIKLAFASSIHKAQGSSYEAGYLDLGTRPMFADHMMYVALSRFRNLDKIGLSRPITNKDIKICSHSMEFLEGFSPLD